jgi:ABC-2 type transport system ATP-binding protein
LAILKVKDIVKNYPNFSLNITNFELDENTIKAVVGKNGAGKTTFLKAIISQIQLDQGEIFINGESNKSKLAKQEIGFSFGDTSILNPDFNAVEVDKIMSALYSSWDSPFYFTLLNDLNIPLKKSFATFSSGMKVKFNLSTAVAHKPNFLILDEVTSGLDPISRKEILSFLKEIKTLRRTAILFSTHIIEDLKNIADSVSIIREGRIVLEDSIEALDTCYLITSENNATSNYEEIFQNSHSDKLYKVAKSNKIHSSINEIIEYCLA